MRFLIVEHDNPVIMDIFDKIVVLHSGRKIDEDAPVDVQSNKAVIAAYLGTDDVSAMVPGLRIIVKQARCTAS